METRETTVHINKFIAHQTVASLCCTNNSGELHCFSCYYAFDAGDGLLYFKTGDANLHMQWLKHWPQVAGTILPDKLNKLQVKGIQFKGILLPLDEMVAQQSSKRYHLKYPFALAMPGTVQTIRIDWIKMTDNSLGFGAKLIWEREAQTVST